jgi:hypothetical protein
MRKRGRYRSGGVALTGITYTGSAERNKRMLLFRITRSNVKIQLSALLRPPPPPPVIPGLNNGPEYPPVYLSAKTHNCQDMYCYIKIKDIYISSN